MVTVESVTSDKDSATICEEVTFTVTTAPAGYASLIEWTGTGGCSPASQVGGATFATKWPCIGSKQVTASCCGNQASKNIAIGLLEGCEECQVTPTLTLSMQGGEPQYDIECSDCAFNCPCGVLNEPKDIHIENISICFDNCMWKFNVQASASIKYGPCKGGLYDNYVEISNGEDPDLTMENYCCIVNAFDYIVDDSSGEEGCASTTGDCSGILYSNTDCVIWHEAQHAVDYIHRLDLEESSLANNPIMSYLIDCSSDIYTWDCRTVLDRQSVEIEYLVEKAYMDAWAYCLSDEAEKAARAAAVECFNDLATEICDYAWTQGWTPCDSCSN